jgi:Mg-chelatase subunit ChlI
MNRKNTLQRVKNKIIKQTDNPDEMDEECRTRFYQHQILETDTGCVPFVELPLNATEDRLTGSLHIEHILKTGEHRFEPGLLASANPGILYIDEVNLPADHLVDMILDAASSGWNVVEREGISFTHPSRFMLIGTMNPEEGELRPHHSDCFRWRGECAIDAERGLLKRDQGIRITFSAGKDSCDRNRYQTGKQTAECDERNC